MCPGHEINGIVEKVGDQVTRFAVGQRAAVGCMVNSCGKCTQCSVNKSEQYCKEGPIWTYNSKDVDGTTTQGGYSTHIVVDEKFALKFPENLPMDAGAPLLCAGITTYVVVAVSPCQTLSVSLSVSLFLPPSLKLTSLTMFIPPSPSPSPQVLADEVLRI